MDDEIIDRIREAADAVSLADMMLRASDMEIAVHAAVYIAKARALGFGMGETFIMLRLRLLMAPRDAHGLVDAVIAELAELTRGEMSNFVARGGRR